MRGHRAEERLLDDPGLVLAGDDHQHLAGAHDGVGAHGVRLARHLVPGGEEALVGLNGLLGQVDAVGAHVKGVARLVEADVAVVADAQQLQIDAAQAGDHRVIALALGLRVHVGAVRQVDAVFRDVHMIEQVPVHEAPVALPVLARQAAVLVQVYRGDLGKVEVSALVPLDQVLVGAHRGTAGRQAEHAVRLVDDLRGDDGRSLAGHLVVILGADDSHQNPLPFKASLGAHDTHAVMRRTMYYIVYRPSINKVNISRLFLCILSAVRTPCLARRRNAAPPGCASGTGPLMRLLFYVF